MVNLWMVLFPRNTPDSVQVKTIKVCSVMTVFDSIYIYHWEDEKNVIFFYLVQLRISHQKIHNPF